MGEPSDRPKVKLKVREKPKLRAIFANPEGSANVAPLAKAAPPARSATVVDTGVDDQEKTLAPSPKRRPKKPGQENHRAKSAEHVTAARLEVTSPSKIKSHQVTKTVRLEKENSPPWLIVGLAVTALLVGAFAFKGRSHQVAEQKREREEAAASAKELQDRVNFYRVETGRKLNRERVTVEFENQKSLSSRPSAPVPEPRDMMSGLPLAQEKNPPSLRDRLEPANPAYADTQVMNTLHDEQASKDWEARARKVYMEEFVANAAKAGYKVKVDARGQVHVTGQPPPPANLPVLPSGRDPAANGEMPR